MKSDSVFDYCRWRRNRGKHMDGLKQAVAQAGAMPSSVARTCEASSLLKRAAIWVRKAAVLSTGLLLAACATVKHSPVLTPPVLEKAMTPVYPPAAVAANYVGRTVMNISVRADGKVSSVSVAKPSGFGELDEAAMFPASYWRFKPATSDGVATEGSTRIPVSFFRSNDGGLAVVICQALPPSAPDDELTACPVPSRTTHQQMDEHRPEQVASAIPAKTHDDPAPANRIPGLVALKAARTPVSYPPEAIRKRHEGSVELLILVDVNGKPLDIKISKSSGFPELDAAAMQAAPQWTFVPENAGGVRRQGYARVPINFSLNQADEPVDNLPDEAVGVTQEASTKSSQKPEGVFDVEFFDGIRFTGRLDGSRLIAIHQAAFLPQPDGSVPPATPAAADIYAADLEKAYSAAYVAAIRSNGRSYASRCMEECQLTLMLEFVDGSTAWVNLQQSDAEIRLLAFRGLPTMEDAQVLARVVALMLDHPGWEPNNGSLRGLAGPTAKFAMLYYYDTPLRFAAGGKMLAPPPPQPAPPPPPSPGSSALNACTITNQDSGTPHAAAASEGRPTEVAVVIGSGGHVEHEWITRSSGSRWMDIAALDKAAGWTFQGQTCSHLRMTKPVLAAEADQSEKR
jgi:periplasmic protein TonB